MALATADRVGRQSAQLGQFSPARSARRVWPGVLCLMLLSVALRSPGVCRPLVGNFATKNATYAMIARNWALGRAPFWRPTTDCMAGGDRGWHLLEVPLAAYAAGAGWAVCGGSLDVWGRAVSIAMSAVSVVLMFLLIRRWHSPTAAYAAALTLALSPVSIIYGQSFMLEASVVCLTLLTLWSFDVWLERLSAAALARCRRGAAPEFSRGRQPAAAMRRLPQAAERRRSLAPLSVAAPRLRRLFTLVSAGWRPRLNSAALTGAGDNATRKGTDLSLLALAATSFALLLLTKIYMVVLLLPLAAMAWRERVCRERTPCRSAENRSRPHRTVTERHRGRSLQTHLAFATIVLAVIPAVAWCGVVMHTANPDQPQSQHVFDSLYRSTTVHHWPHPLLASGEFYARLLYNMAMPGVTPLAMLLAVMGLACRTSRRHAAWLAAMALLVVALPAKFDELQYYTLILVPPLAVLAGVGWEHVWRQWRLPKAAVLSCVLAWVGVSLRLSVGPAFTTPAEDRGVTAAAAAVRELAAVDEPVATLHGTSSDLLYYCDRPGWALSTNDRQLAQKLDDCRRQGARWLVVADLKALAASPCAAELAGMPMVREGDDYRVYQLAEQQSPQNSGYKR